jgi:hypothetical protein
MTGGVDRCNISIRQTSSGGAELEPTVPWSSRPTTSGHETDDLSRRLAVKRSEKDHYVKLYARGHLSDEELDLHLADLRANTDNLSLPLEARAGRAFR